METVESLADQVLRLPASKRLTIVRRILASIDDPQNPEAQAEWEQEIRARIERYDSDPDCALSGPEVLAELDRKLRQ